MLPFWHGWLHLPHVVGNFAVTSPLVVITKQAKVFPVRVGKLLWQVCMLKVLKFWLTVDRGIFHTTIVWYQIIVLYFPFLLIIVEICHWPMWEEIHAIGVNHVGTGAILIRCLIYGSAKICIWQCVIFFITQQYYVLSIMLAAEEVDTARNSALC